MLKEKNNLLSRNEDVGTEVHKNTVRNYKESAATEMLQNLGRRAISVVEHYRTTEDPDKLQVEVNRMVVELAIGRYALPESVFDEVKSFINNCLKMLPELKLFAQYSSETILLYRDGPVEHEVAEADASGFVDYICSSDFYFGKPDKVGSEVDGKYSEALKKALCEYYICFMCNEPEDLVEITDREAYKIVASQMYKFIDELFGEALSH